MPLISEIVLGAALQICALGPAQFSAERSTVVALPAAGGFLRDTGLDGFFEESIPGDFFGAGGTRGVYVGPPFEIQGAKEFDLFAPAVQAIGVDSISSITLSFRLYLRTSTGGIPNQVGIVGGYVGDGLFDSLDANKGDAIGAFGIYSSSEPAPVSFFQIDVKDFVRARMLAHDQFAGFNFRAQSLPPYSAFLTNSYYDAELTFTIVPEPASLLLVVFGVGTCVARGRPQGQRLSGGEPTECALTRSMR